MEMSLSVYFHTRSIKNRMDRFQHMLLFVLFCFFLPVYPRQSRSLLEKLLNRRRHKPNIINIKKRETENGTL